MYFMREIHLLENNEACARFLLLRASQGFLPETFLGIGSFSSQIPKQGSGIALYSTPSFFEHELADSIVHGHFSVFEKESILLQTSMGLGNNISISRWYLIGQHLSIFNTSNIDVKNYLPTIELCKVRSPEEFMQVYLGYLFPHIQEVRAQTILMLFDVKMFCDYVSNFFTWLSNKLKSPKIIEAIVSLSNLELQYKLTSELLWYLSDSVLHPCIAVYPSTRACFQDLVSSARKIRIQGHLSDDLLFKL
jgi:hypothetical protein